MKTENADFGAIQTPHLGKKMQTKSFFFRLFIDDLEIVNVLVIRCKQCGSCMSLHL
jgi:hypothetical protein